MSDAQQTVEALIDLASINAYPIPTMSETDFVKFLLPLLVNVEGRTDIDMTIWLTIAGNAHRPINVLDGQKNVLFTVPPLLARVPTVMPKATREGMDISSILNHYGALRKAEHPVTADLWFEEAMRDSVIPIDELDHIKNLKSWIDIYHRYGISTERLLNGGTTTLAPAVLKPADVIESSDDMSGDFDDL